MFTCIHAYIQTYLHTCVHSKIHRQIWKDNVTSNQSSCFAQHLPQKQRYSKCLPVCPNTQSCTQSDDIDTTNSFEALLCRNSIDNGFDMQGCQETGWRSAGGVHKHLLFRALHIHLPTTGTTQAHQQAKSKRVHSCMYGITSVCVSV